MTIRTEPSQVPRPAPSLRGPHRTRSIRFLGYLEPEGWTLKLYGIAAGGELPRRPLVDALVREACRRLPNGEDANFAIGFAIAHDAGERGFLLLHWWHDENEIHQTLLSGPMDDLAALRPHPSPAIGCIWELAVTDFERRQWIYHVLARDGGPDLEAYVAARYEDDI
jgi:hypothetical protein